MATPRPVQNAQAASWQRGARVAPDTVLGFRVALAGARSDAQLAALVAALSDVRSADYGAYLTTAEALAPHFGASREATRAMVAFAGDSSSKVALAEPVDAVGDVWRLEMAAQDAERAFQTRLFEFQHREHADVRVVRPGEAFALPQQLEGLVAYVDGLESFPTEMQARVMQSRRAARDGRDGGGGGGGDFDPFAVKQRPLSDTDALSRVAFPTPAVIRAQYDVPAGADAADAADANATANQLVIGTFLRELYSERDLRQFVAQFGDASAPFRAPRTRGDCVAGRPGSHGQMATGEASLDVQVVAGLAPGADVEMMCYTALRDPTRAFAADNQEPFLTFLQDVNTMEPPPTVVSVSYTDDECSVPPAYARAVNRELMKSAARGISVVISAGDAGVQGSSLAGFCKVPTCSRFLPMFPASSPYVTSVGATSFKMDAPKTAQGKFPEVATSTMDGALITSGGGFSDLFPMPDYQRNAVTPYLVYADQFGFGELFNQSGRAYPDIAALGHGFPVITNGDVYPTDGTSVSAPLLASLLVLINKELEREGRPALGFLNPLLYQLHAQCPQVFQDVTDGSTACGGLGMGCCSQGHAAIDGWDAASGVGTLRFKTFASDLSDCIDKIRAGASGGHASTESAVLMDQSGWTSTQRHVEQGLIVVAAIAGVALVAVLATLRRQLFPSTRACERYVACHARESAREYLLGRDEDLGR